ncbi:MAG: chorismate mutase [Ndongobacter sp.]|nr:chorismate mutase [Ndongobacter sp.]
MDERPKAPAQQESLEMLREEMDQLNRQLAQLFEARMMLSARIAHAKGQTGKPIRDAAREELILTQMADLVPQYADGVRALFQLLFSLSRKEQTRINTMYIKANADE